MTVRTAKTLAAGDGCGQKLIDFTPLNANTTQCRSRIETDDNTTGVTGEMEVDYVDLYQYHDQDPVVCTP